MTETVLRSPREPKDRLTGIARRQLADGLTSALAAKHSPVVHRLHERFGDVSIAQV
jgi:hypothetical protein